jgi:hypothetical protein
MEWLSGCGARTCNSLHILGRRVLSEEGRRQVKNRLFITYFGRPSALLLAVYLPLRTSLAMVASCMFEVPS